jgi:hypothetical protein
MKALTKNLILFSIGATILTIVFRFTLSTMLQREMFTYIWAITVFYGIAMFILGWIFGKKERQTLPLYDIGFRFHLTTYIICNLIAEIWFSVGLQSDYEKIKVVHWTMIIWGIVLLIHFFFYLLTRKNSIKGIKKSEIFE